MTRHLLVLARFDYHVLINGSAARYWFTGRTTNAAQRLFTIHRVREEDYRGSKIQIAWDAEEAIAILKNLHLHGYQGAAVAGEVGMKSSSTRSHPGCFREPKFPDTGHIQVGR